MAEHSKERKDNSLLIRLSTDKKAQFKQACKDNDTSMTKRIDTFISDYIEPPMVKATDEEEEKKEE